MTLIKSLLLGSAAGIVAVASAQAADLPTRKAAPVEYVKVCNVGGITGWTLPGSDTCVKFSGYITGQFTGGNLSTQYNWGGAVVQSLYGNTLVPTEPVSTSQRILVQATDAPVGLSYLSPTTGAIVPIIGSSTVGVVAGAPGIIAGKQLVLPAQNNTTFFRNTIGWSTRANFGFDMASNTAYGPLIGHFDLNVDASNGFDALEGPAYSPLAYLNTGYLTWAGITAGKAQSFYSFTGGGDNWANFFSPDQKGFNEPLLLAYTASFGGGFSATIAAQSQGTNGASGGGTNITQGSLVYGGQKWPDIVGALHVKQGWGEAQVSGVLHNVNVTDTANNGGTDCGAALTAGVFSEGTLGCDAQQSKVGWGVDAGVKVNLPSFGAGDNFLVTGSYTRSAVWYSGLPDGMWGENGQTNGNGQPMYMSDAFFNPLTNQWSSPTAWSVTGLIEHHFTPQFYVDLEGSVGGLEWSNQGGGCNYIVAPTACTVANFGAGALSSHATSWIIGADLGWNPVNNLNFDLELMYQNTNQDKPTGFIGTVNSAGVLVPGAWQGESSGFAGRFRITRYF